MTTPLHRAQLSSTMFRHRMIVQAPVGSGEDSYGHARYDAEQTLHDNEPCFAFFQSGADNPQETFNQNTQGTREVLVVLCRRDLKIDTTMQIVEIADRRGDTLYAGPYKVVGVGLKGDLKRVKARLISEGRS